MAITVGGLSSLETEASGHDLIVAVLLVDDARSGCNGLVKLAECQADLCQHVVGGGTCHTTLGTLCGGHVLGCELEVFVAELPNLLTGVGLVTHLDGLGGRLEDRHVTKHTGKYSIGPSTEEAGLAQQLILLGGGGVFDVLVHDGINSRIGIVHQIVGLIVPVAAVAVGRVELGPVGPAVVGVVLAISVQTYTRKHVRVVSVGLTQHQIVHLVVARVDCHRNLVLRIEHTLIVKLVRVLLQEVSIALAAGLGKGHRTKYDDTQYMLCYFHSYCLFCSLECHVKTKGNRAVRTVAGVLGRSSTCGDSTTCLGVETRPVGDGEEVGS